MICSTSDMLNTINAYIDEHNISPTIRELSRLTGLHSTSSVHRHIQKLKEDGLIQYKKNRPRTIVVLKEDIKK